MKVMKIVVVALALCGLGFASHAQELTGTLKKIKDTGTITIGYRASSIPSSYLDDSQKPIGYAIDICLKIADAVKAALKLDALTVAYTPVTSANRLSRIADGTADLECGSTTNNQERRNRVSFTNTDFLSGTRFVSKKSNSLKTIEDLKGKSVVSTAGTVPFQQLYDISIKKGLNIHILVAKDHDEAFGMVENDRAAAFVMDDILLASAVAAANDPSLYEVSSVALSIPEPYSIMLPLDDRDFKAVVDKATATLYKSPEMAALYTKWFLSPIPPKGLNLNVPLSPSLAKAFANPSDSPDPSSY